MHILPLAQSHIAEASALFAANFSRLRRAVPILPARMEDPAASAEMLENLLAHAAPGGAGAVAALEGERLLGYMGWWVVDGFRSTARRVGYVPVWAHAVDFTDANSALVIYRALYAAAARKWHEAGCHAHAASLLADDPLTHSFWFWNSFGAMVVDAVRVTGPLGAKRPHAGITARRAGMDDAPLTAQLEAEHWRHYAEPPVLMVASHPSSAGEMADLIADPRNRVWLAFQKTAGGETPAGYIRFEGSSEGATELVSAGPGGNIAITGAYVRPEFRGRGAAPAMLDAALRELAESGIPRCSVDFESFNPEASTLWMKYFTPIALSVMRVPERSGN